MKILLLTDNQSYKDKVSDLILDQLIGFLPRQTLCAYIINSIKGSSKTIAHPTLQTIPSCITNKPTLNDLEFFAKEHNVTAIWCILNGPEILDFVTQISDKIKLPIYTQIIQPPQWLKDKKTRQVFYKKKLEHKFKTILNRSAAFAIASFNLAEQYQIQYNTKAIPIVWGLDPTLCLNPKPIRTTSELESKSGTFTIGVLGDMYLYEAWSNLLLALEFVKWKIGDKKIKIRYIARNLFITASNADIEFLGERTQKETISLLAETDLLYYANSFVEEKAYQLSNCTLPLELHCYLATGRPILCHAPEYDAVAKFLKKYQAAIEVSDFEKSSLYQAIERCMWDVEFYEKIARNGHKILLDNLTTSYMEAQFKKFINYTALEEGKR